MEKTTTDSAVNSAGISSTTDSAVNSGRISSIKDSAVNSGGISSIKDSAVNSGGIILSKSIMLFCAVIIAAGGYWYIKRKKKTTPNKEIDNKLKKEIEKKLVELEKEFEKEAISYYLPILILDSKVNEDKRDELIKEHFYKGERVYTLPIIYWDNFTITGDEGNILDEILKEKIKNFDEKDKYTIKDSFKFLLLKQAKQKTIDIIKKAEEQKN